MFCVGGRFEKNVVVLLCRVGCFENPHKCVTKCMENQNEEKIQISDWTLCFACHLKFSQQKHTQTLVPKHKHKKQQKHSFFSLTTTFKKPFFKTTTY